MSAADYHSPELEELLAELTAGDISAEGSAKLDALLATDEAARNYYRGYIALHVMLEALHTPTPNERLLPVDLAGEPLETRSPKPPSPVLGGLGGWLEGSLDWRRHTLRFAALMLALTSWVWVWFFTFLMPHTSPTAPRVARQETPPAAAVVARLNATFDCRWSAGTTAPRRGDALRTGQRLSLDAGRAEIVFRNGSRVLLQGPARFELTRADAGHLAAGRLTAQIGRRARSFQIETPLCTIVDRGTEFDVWVAATGETEVHCIEGGVEVRAADAQARQLLNGGEALRVARAGGVDPMATDAWRFERIASAAPSYAARLPSGPAEATATSAEVMRQLGPIAYWRFEDPPATRQTADASGRKHVGQLVGDATLSPRAGREGTALWLGGDGARVEVADHADFQFGGGSFSVVGWIRVRGPGQHALIGKGKSRPPASPHWLARLDESGRLRLGMNDGRKENPLATFETAPGPDLRDGRWHHLGGVFDREALEQRYYVDGEQTHVRALTDVPAAASFDNALPLTLGRADGQYETRGFLDELALFNRSLRHEEIEQLYHAAR